MAIPTVTMSSSLKETKEGIPDLAAGGTEIGRYCKLLFLLSLAWSMVNTRTVAPVMFEMDLFCTGSFTHPTA